MHKERHPIVSAITSQTGSQEVISFDIVFSHLVNVADDVNLVLRVDVVLSQTLIDQSHKSALLMESRVCRHDFVKSEPSELT